MNERKSRSESGESGRARRLKNIHLAFLSGVSGVRSLGAVLFVCRRSRRAVKLDHFIPVPRARDGNQKVDINTMQL